MSQEGQQTHAADGEDATADAHVINLRFLQHIGKIDWPSEVVIFLHICKIVIFVFLSIYRYFGDIWFSGEYPLLLDFSKQP